MDDSASDSSDNVQNESYVEAVTKKRKNMETGKEPPVVSETVVLYKDHSSLIFVASVTVISSVKRDFRKPYSDL